MAEHMNLYERARYYDVIFDRDVSREVAFLEAAFERYTGKGQPASALDIACGPGYHGRAFARQGIRTVGVDINEAMIELAKEKDDAEDLTSEWLVADMRRIQLSRQVDLAFIMFDGLDALLTQDDLVQHLRSVAASLTHGGVYIIDLTHPRDCSFQTYSAFRYQGETDGVNVEIVWATNQPRFDLVTGVADTELELRINDRGKMLVVKDRAKERLLLPQELELLATVAGGLEVVGWYGDYSLSQPLDWSDASWRMLAVLRRTES
jgi:SAM-dependent methyltransferase